MNQSQRQLLDRQLPSLPSYASASSSEPVSAEEYTLASAQQAQSPTCFVPPVSPLHTQLPSSGANSSEPLTATSILSELQYLAENVNVCDRKNSSQHSISDSPATTESSNNPARSEQRTESDPLPTAHRSARSLKAHKTTASHLPRSCRGMLPHPVSSSPRVLINSSPTSSPPVVASSSSVPPNSVAAVLSIPPQSVTTTVVTTTTTTTTEFRPWFFARPNIEQLDASQYPLANVPTPLHLRQFGFEVDGVRTVLREVDSVEEQQQLVEKSVPTTRVYTSFSGGDRSRSATLSPPAHLRSHFHSNLNLQPSHLIHHRSQHSVQHSGLLNPTKINSRKRPAPPDTEDLLPASMVEAPRTSGQFSHSHVRTNSRAGGSSLRAHKRRGSIGSPEVNVVHSPVHMVHAGAESSSNIGLLMQERSVSPNRVLGGSSGHGKLAHIVAGPTPLTPFPEASGTIRDHEMDSPSHSGRSPNLPSPTMSPTIMHQPVPPQLGASMLGLDNLDGDLPSYVTHLGIDQEQQHMLWAQHRRNISGSFDGSGNPTAAAVEAAARRGAPNFGRLMASVESIVTSFDQLPIALKNYALMHVLRRCPYPTLQFASSLILPTLKRDFLALLPVELSYQILGYVDLRCLGRCAQVSKSWNRVVDGDGAELAVWKRRLILEGWYNKDEVNRAQRRYSRTTRQMYMEEDSSGDVDMADRSSLSVGSRSSSIVSRYPPHLFKKLHRRHHMIRQNWNHGVYEQVSFPGHDTNVVTCLQFDAEKIVAGSDVPPTIHIYDTRTGRLRRKLIGHEGGIWALQYSDSTLVSGSTDRTVRVWDMDSGRCTHLFEGHTSTVRCLIILKPTMNPERGVMEPSEPLIVTGSRDASLRVWRLPDPRRDIPYYPSNGDENNNPQGYGSNPYFRHAMLGHTSSVRALAGAGNVLVSGSYDSTVRVWDLERGECVHVCRGHSEKVYSVGYNHETRRAVSGSMDTTVRVWCTRTGTELFRLDGHTNLVGLLELSPQYLISAAADATLRIWNPETSACLSTLTGHAAAITCFHHDPKLNRIVSGAENGIKVWELSNRAGRGVGASQNGGVIHGRFIRDLMKDVQGVWRVRMDERRLVCAVQRDETRKTSFEVLDFGAGIDDDDDEKYEEDDVEEEEEREGGGGGGSGEDLEDEEGQEGVETEEEYEADVDDVEA